MDNRRKRYITSTHRVTPEEMAAIREKYKYLVTWGDTWLAEWMKQDVEYWLHLAATEEGLIDYRTAERLMDYLTKRITPEYLAHAKADSLEKGSAELRLKK